MTQLFKLALLRKHRFGIVLQGEDNWQDQFCQMAAELSSGECFKLGGVDCHYSTQWRAMGKGQQLLGQECGLLVIDLRNDVDANSLTALIGTLRGGGLAIFLQGKYQQANLANQWLSRALGYLLVVKQHHALPELPSLFDGGSAASPFEMQNKAIEHIHKVVTGHRRRPLVLTADRGRGKTSALGIAAAELMMQRKMRILVTAPNVGNVTPLFDHAQQRLVGSERTKFRIDWNGSSIEFVAPDELVRGSLECDLVLVDEAAAMPLPILIKIVERYHRAVFSTTIHGYEGCGRGFTLKFQTWLSDNRPGTRFYHMETPIRWSANDPLELWQYQTFLLECELAQFDSVAEASVELIKLNQATLFESPEILTQCFALLVNAHYQTTPNDLFLLLSDSAMKFFAVFDGINCIGCIVGVEEGGLDKDTAEQVLLGKRRPKGHLVASSLVSHLAVEQAATDSSLRVMRIAVHPQWQGQGIGTQMLSRLKELTNYCFYSTSFGVTTDLLNFWLKNRYQAIKLGSTRDQASGCHSLIMVDGDADWIERGVNLLSSGLNYHSKQIFRDLDIDLMCCLADSVKGTQQKMQPIEIRLLSSYSLGGTNYENVAPIIERAVWLVGLNKDFALLFRKAVQQWSWSECASEFGLTGRKQLEVVMRKQVSQVLERL
ncbi:GNAT family N-acetyltransferase [Vibrio kasasachensis]|uniref:tRNA(Met) cytidine acetyltransferase TmcA n=1 Tax=Vibrio kasasachensis TaxID=2910248 RepID=UPI003D0BC29C